jgi:hypothetical protein
MKNLVRLSAALLSILAVVAGFGFYSQESAEAAPPPQKSKKSAAATQQPKGDMGSLPGADDSLYGPSFSSLAWGLFMEAMTPTEDGSLTFEGWTEECQLNPNMVGCPSAASLKAARVAGNGKVRLLHGGATAHTKKIAGTDCGGMITTPVGGYRAPSNLTKNAMFCEEVFVSPPEASFVKGAGLTTLAGQQIYGSEHTRAINFPGTGLNQLRPDLDSMEVKLDWVPAASFKNPTFACPDPTNNLYTQTINGTCYALVGVHITSKVMPTWLWATFEPNSKITNPNRCDAKLYGACFDPWGTTSSEPYGKGKSVRQSDELRQAMAAAQLHPAFRNYFLTGVQTKFVDNYGKPIQLGNSFVEFNQGVAPGKSSCITCHQYAHFDGKQTAQGRPENNFGKPPQGWPSIGYACNQNQNENCFPADTYSTLQDFSWMLGKMPYSDASSSAPAPKLHEIPKVVMKSLR